MLGHCLGRLGQRAEALAELREAVKCRPDVADPYLYLGEVLAEDGKPEAPAKPEAPKPEAAILSLAPAPAALVLVPEAPARPEPVCVRAKPTFKPCVSGDHETCAVAYFDDAGAPVRCPCACHVQGAMFAKPKPQGSLF